ncbi:hypothetical protein [Actinomycetospora straminea]|uniref:Uncharacterized protein n=1 Tax=Actinomycetospora straminea TaxID=663607 RepID=A0ABP9ELW0_9PSEU|nr:hypothetical protein [Actinomycetospora straminea]MDD7934972.1 hypothetical protein [Actinomycetospora straminea]
MEVLKRRLEQESAAATKKDQANDLMVKYANPLARSAFDLQSRLYNIANGHSGGADPEYFRMNTLYLLAEFLGWLEIVRREIQFLDLEGEASARGLKRQLHELQRRLARTGTESTGDLMYLYWGQQRAIGEVMIVARPDAPARGAGPSSECIGYAKSVERQGEPNFSKWFDRIGGQIDQLRQARQPGKKIQLPHRLVYLQSDLVDLINLLDPNKIRLPGERGKLTSYGFHANS